jgi:hypothetical protein
LVRSWINVSSSDIGSGVGVTAVAAIRTGA